MGRARLSVGQELIAYFLCRGIATAMPVRPLHGVKVIDVALREWTVDLLVESPDLEGAPDALMTTAPNFNAVYARVPVLETEAGDIVTLALSRIADRRCECPTSITASDPPVAASCPACLARHAIAHLPSPWLETARAVRGTLGELVAEPDPGEHTDEVPGS